MSGASTSLAFVIVVVCGTIAIAEFLKKSRRSVAIARRRPAQVARGCCDFTASASKIQRRRRRCAVGIDSSTAIAV
jgi:hypothetical protein